MRIAERKGGVDRKERAWVSLNPWTFGPLGRWARRSGWVVGVMATLNGTLGWRSLKQIDTHTWATSSWVIRNNVSGGEPPVFDNRPPEGLAGLA